MTVSGGPLHVTLAGFSLGGCLVMRAATHEPRVARVIAWDILTNLFEASRALFESVGLGALTADFDSLPAPVLDAAVKAGCRSDLLLDWFVEQGARVMGVDTTSSLFQGWNRELLQRVPARLRASSARRGPAWAAALLARGPLRNPRRRGGRRTRQSAGARPRPSAR